MQTIYRKILPLFLALFCVFSANAQYTQSTYSQFSLGDLNWGLQGHNAAMGGTGISDGSSLYISTINPASFGYNQSATFQMGLALDRRNFTNGASSYNSFTGGFKDFVMSLPIKLGKWNMGVGVAPVTSVNFSSISATDGPEGNGNVVSTFEGNGGLDEVYITNAFRIGKLLLGVKTSYLFGVVEKRNQTLFSNVNTIPFSSTVYEERISFSDVNLNLGGIYKFKSGSSFFNVGGFYELEANVRGRNLTKLDTESINGAIIKSDTLVNGLENDLLLPARLGFGVSYDYQRKLSIAVDFQTQDWSKHTNFEGVTNPSLGRAFRLGVGTSFVPDLTSRKYLELIRYRVGFNYEQTPYLQGGEAINDIGISFGASLPVSSSYYGGSQLNFGVTLGRRGRTDNALIKENYVRFDLSFSIFDISWFSRGKFD